MNRTVALVDFDQWKRANRESRFSLVDYAFAALHGQVAHADGAVAFADLFWPNFIEIDGLVLISPLFSKEKLEELRARGLSDRDVELWMNLLSVDGLLGTLKGTTDDHVEYVSRVLAESWQQKLARDFPSGSHHATVKKDTESGDVCVTVLRS